MDVPPARPARRIRWYLLLPLLGLIFLPVGLWFLSEQPVSVKLEGDQWVRDTGEYAGVEACRECHASLVEEQLASNHARTVRDLSKERPEAPFGNGQEVLDVPTGVHYSTALENSEAHLTLARGSLKISQRLAFELGAGVHARGYLFHLEDGSWVDARLNHYSSIKRWDFTSSQEKPQKYLIEQPLGRPMDSDEVLRCFTCHSTVVRADPVKSDAGVEYRVRPDRSTLNITCESCHGPRAQHARDFRAGKPGAAKQTWSADSMNKVCGRCHGLENLQSSHPVIARFQPWGVDQSRCFRASAGRLSCTSCHDPHLNASREPAFYERKCLSCHDGAKQSIGRTVCKVNRASGCVGCHMPIDNRSMRHVTFTDHRIRVVRDQERASK